MRRYRCVSACGYVYDPAKGDPTCGITEGTPFERVPDNWVCPICGAKKRVFRKVD